MPKKQPVTMPTFRSVAIDVSVITAALCAIVLTAKEFSEPAEWFVTWVKDEHYRAPGLFFIICIVALVKNVFVAAQIKEIEGSRFNPIGNRQQRRAAQAIHRKSK